jgi:membrane associated rhomboid family serine protease
MIPLKDENPTRTAPWLIFVIIGINALVFLGQVSMGLQESALRFGLIPAELVHDAGRVYSGPQMGLPPGGQVRNFEPSWATLFTSMFMHGSWFHLIFNMWFLWIFGNNVEDRLGHITYIALYLATGVAGTAAFVLMRPEEVTPLVGASGAVAGVLGAYLVIYPRHSVVSLVGWWILPIPAGIFLAVWFFAQFVVIDIGVAWEAHVGGFLAGMLLALVLRPIIPARPGVTDRPSAASRRRLGGRR